MAMRDQDDAGRGRLAFWATVAASLWAIALLIGALLLPVYSSGSTLIEVNGPGVLVPVGVPALVAVLVGLALHRKCVHGSRSSGYVAGVLVGLLGAFCLVSMFSIGVFVLPVAMLLTLAATLTPFPETGPGRIGYP